MKAIKNLFGLGLLVLMVSVFFTSCGEEETPEPEIEQEQTVPENDIIPIDTDDPILVLLMNSEYIQGFNTEAGELLLDRAEIIKYENDEAAPTVYIPIQPDNGEMSISAFVAIYNEEKQDFITFIMDIAPEDFETDIDAPFTGTIEYKSIENHTLLVGHFKDGITTEIQEFPEIEDEVRGFRLGCTINCIYNFIDQGASPSGLVSFCTGSFNCCRTWITYWNPCCGAFGGCIVGSIGLAGYCVWACWD